jgi:hypothetical protein
MSQMDVAQTDIVDRVARVIAGAMVPDQVGGARAGVMDRDRAGVGAVAADPASTADLGDTAVTTR